MSNNSFKVIYVNIILNVGSTKRCVCRIFFRKRQEISRHYKSCVRKYSQRFCHTTCNASRIRGKCGTECLNTKFPLQGRQWEPSIKTLWSPFSAETYTHLLRHQSEDNESNKYFIFPSEHRTHTQVTCPCHD